MAYGTPVRTVGIHCTSKETGSRSVDVGASASGMPARRIGVHRTRERLAHRLLGSALGRWKRAHAREPSTDRPETSINDCETRAQSPRGRLNAAERSPHRLEVEACGAETDPHWARGSPYWTKVESRRSEPDPIARVPDAEGPKAEAHGAQA